MRGDDIVMGDPLYVWHFTAGEAAGRNGYYRLPPSPMVDVSSIPFQHTDYTLIPDTMHLTEWRCRS